VPTSSEYAGLSGGPVHGQDENPKTKAQKSHNVTGASSVPVDGAFETESQRQARRVLALAEATGGWGVRPPTSDRSRRVQQSSLAEALKHGGRFTGIPEAARTYGRGGLGGSLGSGAHQASRHRPPSSSLFAGGGGFRARTETADAAVGPVMGDMGLNVIGSKLPTEHKDLPRGAVAPLFEGRMQARRVALHADEGVHEGRTTLRTPGQAIETGIRRADRQTRRTGGPALELGASLALAQDALAKLTV